MSGNSPVGPINGNGRRGKNLSMFELGVISGMLRKKATTTEIAASLDRPQTTIQSAIDRLRKNPTPLPPTYPGRPRKLNNHDEQVILRTMRDNPSVSISQIAKQSGLQVSTSTVRSALSRIGMEQKKANCKASPRRTKTHVSNQVMKTAKSPPSGTQQGQTSTGSSCSNRNSLVTLGIEYEQLQLQPTYEFAIETCNTT